MSKVRIEVHAPDSESAQFRALAVVKRPGSSDDQYGGYGLTPLAAAIDLAKTLANVVGYERHEFDRPAGFTPYAEWHLVREDDKALYDSNLEDALDEMQADIEELFYGY